MLQNNISMAKLLCNKPLKNLMTNLVTDLNLIILFQHFNTIDRGSMQLFEHIFTVVNFWDQPFSPHVIILLNLLIVVTITQIPMPHRGKRHNQREIDLHSGHPQ